MNVSKIEAIMEKAPLTLDADTSVKDGIQQLLKKKVSSAAVVDESGKVVGVFSLKDALGPILGDAYYDQEHGLVSDVMSKDVIDISPSKSLLEVASIFMQTSYHHLPVVDDGKLVGEVSRWKLIEGLQELWAQSETEMPHEQQGKLEPWLRRSRTGLGRAMHTAFRQIEEESKKKPKG